MQVLPRGRSVKRFRFALQGLEKLRQARVDEARLALAKSASAQRVEEENIMTIEEQIQNTAAGATREGILDMTEVLEEERYVNDLRRRRTDAFERLGQWIAVVEEDRQRLLKASQEHKALEKLHERRHLEFMREVLREEGHMNDEAASVGDWRQRKGA
jgi:flagellar export protein FliJ